MENLKTLRLKYEDFFNAHAQVRTFMYGALTDFTAKADKQYTAVNIEYQNGVPLPKIIRHVYNVTIADRMDLNFTNSEHDAVSNCTDIALDFIGFLLSTGYTYRPSSVQPFRQAANDMLAGVVFSFSIDIPSNVNTCTTPIKTP